MALFAPQTIHPGPQPYCKPMPGSAEWPSQSAWQALNASISGRLIVPVPPGQVCQHNSSFYNAAACEDVYQEWSNSSWHASDPFTSDYNDEACLPSNLAPCSAKAYPAYVINAAQVSHVQAGIRFAKETGVRLIVKGTGHDISGRPQALSIWMHNIRGINVTLNGSCAKSHGGVAAVTIAAGMRMREIYAAAAEHNITIVGGGDVDVGIGGWITGGGHSPLSSKYGLGADQVLEMEVVTANGSHLTINETSYPGLFWAMRGGGGSTFAVMVSVTVRAYPSIGATWYTYSYNTTADTDTFWSLLTFSMDNFQLYRIRGAATPTPQGIIYGIWIVPEKSIQESKSIIAPMEQTINDNTFGWDDQVVMGIPRSIFLTLQSVGENLRLGSRLLGRRALETDPATLKKLLKQTTTNPQNAILGSLVAGQGVKNVKIPGGSNAVLPAWRDAYIHFILPRVWPFLNETAKIATTNQLRNVEVAALRLLAPDSGAYVNEADPTEPNWQQAFWGANYPRLLQLKNYWDPTSVFWCIPCVGHSEWAVESNSSIEGGIGQTPGRICQGLDRWRQGRMMALLRHAKGSLRSFDLFEAVGTTPYCLDVQLVALTLLWDETRLRVNADVRTSAGEYHYVCIENVIVEVISVDPPE
ncbi:FAD binding domain-containing protein [Exophiala viscosa]|uniref:FAD binding domain-containing protein n=1 Tax=Exophiala viscosa TaxID=2486360 RepID=A0AAN6DLS6_9EURO|nr:FAD binding domain-containing protein [Exophiala viscosa]